MIRMSWVLNRSLIVPVAALFGMFVGTHSTWAATISDNFDTSHDYITDGVTGTIWDGVQATGGIVSVANANTSNAGRLTVTSINADFSPINTVFLLYINVTGDFTATVQVTSANNPDHHDMGLIARLADVSSDGDPGEDFLLASHFANQGVTRFTGIDNGAVTDFTTDLGPLFPFLKLTRSGDLFTYTRADNAGFGGIENTNFRTDSFTRTDLAGLPLQVGIWQATFRPNTGTATFDNFSLTTADTETVPEPSTYALALIGLAGLGLLAWRRHFRFRISD